MKKRILSSILVLFIFVVGVMKVYAADPLFKVGWNLEAVAPDSSKIPSSDAKTYGTVTTEFDFSHVKFSKAGGGTIDGKSNLSKIIISEFNNSGVTNNTAKRGSGETNDTAYLSRLFNNKYFTAYCLDDSKKYPEYGLFNSEIYAEGVKSDGTYDGSAITDPTLFQTQVIMASVVNDPNLTSMMNKLYEVYGAVDDVNPIYGSVSFVVLTDGKDEDDFYKYLMNPSSNPETKIGIQYIGFESLFGSTRKVFFVTNKATAIVNEIKSTFSVTDDDIFFLTGSSYTNTSYNDDRANFYPLSATIGTTAFQRYKKKTNIGTSYNHALWIVENSYPTLSIDDSLKQAGFTADDITTYNTQVSALYPLWSAAEAKEMVTYGVVQYAVWKVNGGKAGGESLGDSITCSNCTMLDKLYKYLIDSNNVPANYNNIPFSKDFTMTKPAQGKELYKKTDTVDLYGPFSVSYNAVVEGTGKIQYTITSEDSTGVKIVDANFNQVSQLDKGQQFYIQVDNKKDIKNVKLNFTLSNAVTFVGGNNDRGKIYEPLSAISQNTLIGGKATTTNITGTIQIEVVGNPNTGIQNIALLLMVTLIAFTLGYLVLSYKQKSITLQQ